MTDAGHLLAADAAAAVGISKPTLLRWIKEGKVPDAERRNRNNWRLFSPAEVAAIRSVAAATKTAGDRK